MTIKANGKVGIGITNPAYKLDVDGSLNLAFDSGIRSGGLKILTTNFNGGNLFIGYHAGDTNQYVNVYQGANNTFVGQNAGRSNTYGTLNSYFGNGAGYYTTGSCNTFAGTGAGVYAYTGSHNTFVGYSAGLQTSYGSYNCFLGDSAGWRNYGDDNVYIGHLATAPHYATLTNSAAIGSHAAVTASNSMMFGNNAVNFWGFGLTTPVAGQALVVGSSASNGNGAYLTTGGVWTDISNLKTQENITQLDKEDMLNRINKLEVTKWKYKGTGNEYHIGPMADDFYKLFEVGSDSAISSMDKTGVLFLGLKALIERNTIMQSALNEQQVQIEKQQDQIEALKATVQEILQRQPLNLTSNADAKPAVGLTNISLEQNTPNPVSNTTNVPYSIPQNAKNAQLIIRNNSGEMVRQLALPAGAGVASIDASVLSSGTYNYSLIVDGKIIRSRKMIVSH